MTNMELFISKDKTFNITFIDQNGNLNISEKVNLSSIDNSNSHKANKNK